MSENKRKDRWQRVKPFLKKALFFLANPRLLLCLLIGWLITNGWSYLMLAAGMYFTIPWMVKVASAYMAFLWFPFTPEKIVTILLAIALLRRLFPKDQNTLGLLKEMLQKRKEKKQAEKGTACAAAEKLQTDQDVLP